MQVLKSKAREETEMVDGATPLISPHVTDTNEPKRPPGRPPMALTDAVTRGGLKQSFKGQSGKTTFPKPSGGINMKKFEHFIKYWNELTPAMLSRAKIHIYRDWPVIDRTLSGEKNQSIQVIEEDPVKGTSAKCPYDADNENWKQQILHEFGSGDYKFIMTEIGVQGALAICRFVSVRDSMMPPKLNLRELNKGDKLNHDYIESLRRQGVKLPGDPDFRDDNSEGENENMKAVEQLTNAVVEMASRATQAPPAPQQRQTNEEKAESKGIDLMASAIDKTLEYNRAMQSNQVDPLKMLDGVGEIIAKISPKTDNNIPILTLLMQQAEKAEERNAALQRELRDREERRIKEDAERREREEARLAMERERMEKEVALRLEAMKPKSMVDQLKEVNELKELLGVKKRREDDDDDDDGGKKKDTLIDNIVKLAPLAATTLTTLFTLGANMYHNYKAKPGEPLQTVPNAAPAAVNEAAQQLASGLTPEQMEQQKQTHQFLQQIEGPLLTHFFGGDRGLDGHTFAHHIVTNDPNGMLIYMQIRAAGPDQLMQILSTYPPIWSKIGGLPQDCQRFANDFMEYEAWKQGMTEEEEDDETTAVMDVTSTAKVN